MPGPIWWIKVCQNCHGPGLEPGSFQRPFVKCQTCNGTGYPHGYTAPVAADISAWMAVADAYISGKR